MSGCRRFAIVVALTTMTAALVVSTGVASGAAPAVPSAKISVHADPGHISTRFVGSSCGGDITLTAVGPKEGAGRAACGRAWVSVAASPGGTFDDTFATPTQSSFVCQANAMFAGKGVDVTCTENVD
ncbi:MAG: hypothetical protein C5B48_10060 [Candidatus Rokuibacteriota bacterium]|nr:MAG: hypothetical protein C5B48_10060 [Candidatus Rokubacteria bacterium]